MANSKSNTNDGSNNAMAMKVSLPAVPNDPNASAGRSNRATAVGGGIATTAPAGRPYSTLVQPSYLNNTRTTLTPPRAPAATVNNVNHLNQSTMAASQQYHHINQNHQWAAQPSGAFAINNSPQASLLYQTQNVQAPGFRPWTTNLNFLASEAAAGVGVQQSQYNTQLRTNRLLKQIQYQQSLQASLQHGAMQSNPSMSTIQNNEALLAQAYASNQSRATAGTTVTHFPHSNITTAATLLSNQSRSTPQNPYNTSQYNALSNSTTASRNALYASLNTGTINHVPRNTTILPTIRTATATHRSPFQEEKDIDWQHSETDVEKVVAYATQAYNDSKKSMAFADIISPALMKVSTPPVLELSRGVELVRFSVLPTLPDSTTNDKSPGGNGVNGDPTQTNEEVKKNMKRELTRASSTELIKRLVQSKQPTAYSDELWPGVRKGHAAVRCRHCPSKAYTIDCMSEIPHIISHQLLPNCGSCLFQQSGNWGESLFQDFPFFKVELQVLCQNLTEQLVTDPNICIPFAQHGETTSIAPANVNKEPVLLDVESTEEDVNETDSGSTKKVQSIQPTNDRIQQQRKGNLKDPGKYDTLKSQSEITEGDSRPKRTVEKIKATMNLTQDDQQLEGIHKKSKTLHNSNEVHNPKEGLKGPGKHDKQPRQSPPGNAVIDLVDDDESDSDDSDI